MFTITEQSTLVLNMSTSNAGILLRKRLHEAGLSQAAASRIFRRSRAWGSQELFADPKKTLRRMIIENPAAVDEFAITLGWRSWEEMAQELNVFEDEMSALVETRSETTQPKFEVVPALRDAIERFGDDFPDLQAEKWQQYLASFRSRNQRDKNAIEWLDFYRNLKKFGVEPE